MCYDEPWTCQTLSWSTVCAALELGPQFAVPLHVNNRYTCVTVKRIERSYGGRPLLTLLDPENFTFHATVVDKSSDKVCLLRVEPPTPSRAPAGSTRIQAEGDWFGPTFDGMQQYRRDPRTAPLLHKFSRLFTRGTHTYLGLPRGAQPEIRDETHSAVMLASPSGTRYRAFYHFADGRYYEIVPASRNH